jgi:hypothetical protein
LRRRRSSLRRTPEKWNADVEEFAKQDAERGSPVDAVLYVGSSQMWDTAKVFPVLATTNRGFGESQVCDSAHFADVFVVK